MPIYEWSCGACGITFESLAPVGQAQRRRPCPRCGRSAPRTVSAFAIGAASAASSPEPANAGAQPHRHRPGAGRPPIPSPARLCWMDDRSAQRLAAYKNGRGAEYDDKMAAREDLRKQRGEPAPPPDHSHSPVAKVLARKKAREAAQAAAKVMQPPTLPTTH